MTEDRGSDKDADSEHEKDGEERVCRHKITLTDEIFKGRCMDMRASGHGRDSGRFEVIQARCGEPDNNGL